MSYVLDLEICFYIILIIDAHDKNNKKIYYIIYHSMNFIFI